MTQGINVNSLGLMLQFKSLKYFDRIFQFPILYLIETNRDDSQCLIVGGSLITGGSFFRIFYERAGRGPVMKESLAQEEFSLGVVSRQKKDALSTNL